MLISGRGKKYCVQHIIELNSPRFFAKLSRTTFADKFDSSSIGESTMLQK